MRALDLGDFARGTGNTLAGEYGGDLPVNVVENLQQSVDFLVGKEPSTIFTDGEDDEPVETVE